MTIKVLARYTFALLPCFAAGAAPLQQFTNQQVAVREYVLHPGTTVNVDGRRPAVMAYYTGKVEYAPASGEAAATIANSGPQDLHFVRVEFLGAGVEETWGAAGLSPEYKVTLENRYVRAYDIKIAAGHREPQHTHKARVVVCLSGAELKHIMPDGSEEPSTLRTGEIAWRNGGTHIGQNLGKTDLWVIAIEPK